MPPLSNNKGGIVISQPPSVQNGPLFSRPNSLLSSRTHNFKCEKERLDSFAGFPSGSVDVRSLAAAGFWYTKSSDIVRCAFCDVEVGRWEEGDDPMVEHRKWSSNCSFLQRSEVGNIPVDPLNPPPLPPVQPSGFDECGIFNTIKSTESCSAPLEKLGIQKRYNPAHPTYSTLESRLESFNNWPIGLKLKPQDLAEAGFFYTGMGDKTICFQCGGGLKDWAETDEPWREHALYFSKCGYLVQIKGREFITEVLGKRPETLTPEEIKALATPKECPLIKVQEHPSSISEETSSTRSDTESSATQSVASSLSSQVHPKQRTDSESIQDATACKICFNEEIGVVFLPCAHLVACVKCAPSLDKCAVCRNPITHTIRVFL